jgi:hypothetical protein
MQRTLVPAEWQRSPRTPNPGAADLPVSGGKLRDRHAAGQNSFAKIGAFRSPLWLLCINFVGNSEGSDRFLMDFHNNGGSDILRKR